MRYAWLTLAHLGRYRPHTYRIETEGGVRDVEALMVCIANSRQFGGGAIIAPDARVDDGTLNLVIVGARPAWRALCELPALFRWGVTSLVSVWSLQIRDARVTTSEIQPVHVDGELVEASHVITARVHPQALRVRMPRRPLP
jgi:diacylglycerol kinase (ATP)